MKKYLFRYRVIVIFFSKIYKYVRVKIKGWVLFCFVKLIIIIGNFVFVFSNRNDFYYLVR